MGACSEGQHEGTLGSCLEGGQGRRAMIEHKKGAMIDHKKHTCRNKEHMSYVVTRNTWYKPGFSGETHRTYGPKEAAMSTAEIR